MDIKIGRDGEEGKRGRAVPGKLCPIRQIVEQENGILESNRLQFKDQSW